MTIKLAMASVPIFRLMPPETVQKLSAMARIVEKGRGEAVLLYGEPSPGLYVVGDGVVRVYAKDGQASLTTLAVGDSFGEMSFLERTRASATIRADGGPAKLVLFPAEVLAQGADADPVFGRFLHQGLATALSMKLRSTTERYARDREQGRSLLRAIAAADDAVSAVPASDRSDGGALGAESKLLAAQLDECGKLLAEFVRQHPDKAGSLQALGRQLDAARARHRGLHAEMERQSAAAASFTESLATFVASFSGH